MELKTYLEHHGSQVLLFPELEKVILLEIPCSKCHSKKISEKVPLGYRLSEILKKYNFMRVDGGYACPDCIRSKR